MKRYFAILGLLSLLIPLVFGSTFQAPTVFAEDGKNNNKISSLLSLQVEAKLRAAEIAPLEEGRVDILQAMQETGAAITSLNKQRIFIHTTEELSKSQVEELEALGLVLYLDSWIPPVKDHPTGFIIADMPVDKLDELAVKDYVIRLDTAEQVLEPHNDLAAQKINADDVWSANYTGANVTIAVLDSGLDVSHNDIPTPMDSKDFSYWPNLDDTISNNVSGHGTHVTGSALGRGTQSGGVYKGTAPGADLVFLKIGRDNTSSASLDAMVYALKAAVDNYTADIITMSYGSWSSYHDGTREDSQAVDYAVSQGAVVFISAGNEATDDQHYSGNVSASSNTSYIQVNVTNASVNSTALVYNLVWYDGTGTSNDLELEYYSSNYTLLPSINFTQSESWRGTESEWSGYVDYVPSGNSTWYLRVKNNSTNSQFFHLYYSTGYNQAGYGWVHFDSPDPDYTITSPADADSAIAVGAYTTRKYWWDYANYGWQWTYETVDQISTFSSRGPRVDTGAPLKPNIVAPGSGIISCRDYDVYKWANRNLFYIDNDGPNTSNATGGSNDGNGPADYYMNLGTSMATPIAAGVAALILEKYPTWTPAQVKQALESTATDKGASGHDNIYGWGLIDALAAMTTDIPPAMEAILESQGEYYNTAPTFSNFGFDDDEDLDDGWYQMDSYTGNWTVLFGNWTGTSWDNDGWMVPGFGGLSEGSHTIYFKASDNASNVEGESGEWHWQFYKDTIPPSDPTSVNSTSHTLSTWSTNNTITITWTDASDNTSGLDGYSILWNTSANTTPSENKTIEEGSENTTSSTLADGNSHYFHIRSVDYAGNWQSTVHLGPFFIDATPPSMEAIAETERQYYTTAPSFSNFGFDDGIALDDGWYQVDSHTGNWTALFTDVIGTDILDIAIASDNTTIYAAIGTSTLYRSFNGGVTWNTTSVIQDNTTIDADLVAVAPDDKYWIAAATDNGTVYVSDDAGAIWDTLDPVNGIDSINDLALSTESPLHFVAVAGEDGGVAEVWYYEVGAIGARWIEASAESGFDAGDVAAAVAFSPNFLSDEVMVVITEEDDSASGTDNVSFQIYTFFNYTWNSGAFDDYPATIVSNDGVTGLDSASISLSPTYLGTDNTTRISFIGLTIAGDANAIATSGIYRLVDDNVTALETGVTIKIHSIAYNGSNLVAGAYDTTNVWRSADPMETTPTVNVTSALNRLGGDDKVVVAWAGSDVVAATSGNQSAFAVSTDNGETFNDILVITDTSWDNNGWTIPGFAALSQGSHTIYFKASDDIGNIEGESGEWSWQFYKGTPPAGGGGGGGGGGLPGVTPVYGVITDKGKFTEDVTCKSEDKKVELFIPEDTIGKNRVGSLLTSIKIKEMEEPPVPPEKTNVIGLVYDIGPDGATFDPPIDLTIKYDESEIPEGVAEKNLVVATFNTTANQWVELESTVDSENDTIKAKISHFTAFTILAHTRPASFTVASLSVTPDEVDLGESVSISVLITNTGDLTGSYEVSLKIDNVVVQTKEVILDGGDSETISFSVAPDAAGEYEVNINGLLGTFEVRVPAALPALAPAPAVAPAPARFAISDLSVTPSEVKPAEQVTISALVTNTGGSEGNYTVVLKIDGAEEAKKEVTLGAGRSEKVTFIIAKGIEGRYTIDIDGKIGQFTVIVPPPLPAEALPVQPPINWALIGGIIAGCVVATGLLVYFFVWRRRGGLRPS